jgi:hypothetical protein
MGASSNPLLAQHMVGPIFYGWRRIFCRVIAEFERCDLIQVTMR